MSVNSIQNRDVNNVQDVALEFGQNSTAQTASFSIVKTDLNSSARVQQGLQGLSNDNSGSSTSLNVYA
jgi:hypothetical protein